LSQSINFNPDDKTLDDIAFAQFQDVKSDDLRIIDECLDKHFHMLDTLRARQ